jgi:para-aminobenzoate synthetase component 1
LLCGLINVKKINQRSNNFPNGIFYKPQTIIKIRRKISIQSNLKNYNSLFTKNIFTKTNILTPFKINLNFKKYKKIFYQFSKNIKEGKTYQIKICTKYSNKSKINPVVFFWKLMKTNAASESFMIRDNNYSIVSCSPETLIEKQGQFITTKPIAGTMRKNKKTNSKKALHFFKNNIKETKEHNMIVDMERSDLSKICKFNSVKITKLKYVEEHKHLYHYVSEIRGKLKKGITIKQIIKSMMPGGSVIGCPKISTLNLLNQQEKDNRNIFTGSFGFINSKLDMRFNIIIRSILNYKNRSEISVASGVVIDSTPKKEFNENYIKAKSLLNLFYL